MEGGALVAEAVLSGRELAEVAGGLGDDVIVELEDDAAEGLAVLGHIEKAVHRWSASVESGPCCDLLYWGPSDGVTRRREGSSSSLTVSRGMKDPQKTP